MSDGKPVPSKMFHNNNNENIFNKKMFKRHGKYKKYKKVTSGIIKEL